MYSFLFIQWEWNNLVMYFVFSFFLIFLYKKNKWRLHTTYPKREVSFKAPKNLFFESHFCNLSQWWLHWGCRGLSFVLDLSDQICTLVLHGLPWYFFLFVYLCCMIFCCIIFCCTTFCCLYCLLKLIGQKRIDPLW